MTTAFVPDEIVHPASLSLPLWPEDPERVDATGTSFLIVAFDGVGSAAVAAGWRSEAEAIGPTTVALFDTFDDGSVSELATVLRRCRTGVRIMMVGGQHDVLRGLALARAHGACPAELRSFVVHTRDLGFYCAHCRSTHRAQVDPGSQVACPGCGRTVEVHAALNATRGSFLASDVNARNLP